MNYTMNNDKLSYKFVVFFAVFCKKKNVSMFCNLVLFRKSQINITIFFCDFYHLGMRTIQFTEQNVHI